MPGNLVVINGSSELTWHVGDSRMDELIEFLNKIGIQETSEYKTIIPDVQLLDVEIRYKKE